MSTTKKRVTWIDMAKGYGMILVICGHMGLSGNVRIWAYSIHIPLFFLLSGYVFSIKDSFGTFLKKKCKTMLIPYFLLVIPMILFSVLKTQSEGNYSSEYLKLLLQKVIIQRRIFTLWFLACLFVLQIFAYWIIKLLKSEIVISILSVSAVAAGYGYYKIGGQSLPWNIDICLMAFLFFYLGYLYKTHAVSVDRYLDDKHYSIMILVVTVIISVGGSILGYKLSEQHLDMFRQMYGVLPLTYCSAIAGIVCMIIVSKWLVIKPIQYIGSNSLLYFAWHQTIIIPFTVALMKQINVTGDTLAAVGLPVFAYKVIVFVIVIGITTLLNIWFSNTKLKFMIGK